MEGVNWTSGTRIKTNEAGPSAKRDVILSGGNGLAVTRFPNGLSILRS